MWYICLQNKIFYKKYFKHHSMLTKVFIAICSHGQWKCIYFVSKFSMDEKWLVLKKLVLQSSLAKKISNCFAYKLMSNHSNSKKKSAKCLKNWFIYLNYISALLPKFNKSLKTRNVCFMNFLVITRKMWTVIILQTTHCLHKFCTHFSNIFA